MTLWFRGRRTLSPILPKSPMTLCEPKTSTYLCCALLIPVPVCPLLPAWDIVILNKCLRFLEGCAGEYNYTKDY